jgi:uncharacterized membrane protein YkvI
VQRNLLAAAAYLRSRNEVDSLRIANYMSAGRWFRVYVMPAAVFQSAVIGGGYGTGREVVEYFTMQGLAGGLLGLGVATLTLGIILAATFEFARRFAVYDYRKFIKALIGPGWVGYEATYVVAVILVLAVIGSAASDILRDQLGWPKWVSTGLMLVAITAMAFYGRDFVARIMTLWAVLLSAIFLIYFVLTVARFGPGIAQAMADGSVQHGWAKKGLQFALYNVAIMPALLFSVRAIASRSEAILSGLIAALGAIFPALLFHVSFAAHHDQVIAQPLPTYWMISQLGAKWFMGIYLVGLFGTLVQTGIGVIQGLIERLDSWRLERGLAPVTRPHHALLALLTIALSGFLSAVGVVTLVAQGYGLLAWAFLLVYTLPLLTIGLVRLMRTRATAPTTRKEV